MIFISLPCDIARRDNSSRFDMEEKKPATNQPMEKERLRTITLLFNKKIVLRKIRTITTKNENNETKEN